MTSDPKSNVRKAGQHHGDLRRALLDAALRLVRDRTPDAISLRAVAREAGVSPGAPYHHFEDKDALLAAVALEGFLALAHEQSLAGGPNPIARLEGMVSRYVRFAIAHRTHYTVMFRNVPGQVDGAVAVGLREAALQTFATLTAAVLAANPALGPARANQRALMAWALAHGAVEVAPWADDLVPHFSVDALADEVGRSTLALVLAP